MVDEGFFVAEDVLPVGLFVSAGSSVVSSVGAGVGVETFTSGGFSSHCHGGMVVYAWPGAIRAIHSASRAGLLAM